MRSKLEDIEMGRVWTCEPLSGLKPESELCGVEEKLRCDRQTPPMCTKVAATILENETDDVLARLASKEILDIVKERVLAESCPPFEQCQEVKIVAGEVIEVEQSDDYKEGQPVAAPWIQP